MLAKAAEGDWDAVAGLERKRAGLLLEINQLDGASDDQAAAREAFGCLLGKNRQLEVLAASTRDTLEQGLRQISKGIHAKHAYKHAYSKR